MQRHPFRIGQTLADAARLAAPRWSVLLIAFVLLRMLPRVVMGEDYDAGLTGNGVSLLEMLFADFPSMARQMLPGFAMDVPTLLFSAAALAILLPGTTGAGTMARFLHALMPVILLYVLDTALQIIEATSVLPFWLLLAVKYAAPMLLGWLLFVLAAVAADERRLLPMASMRAVQLWWQAPFRLLVLVVLLGAINQASQIAEQLLLNAIPVTDGTLFDWITTVFQECISGFPLPIVAAVQAAAYLHLRKRHDGERPEDTAAVFA